MNLALEIINEKNKQLGQGLGAFLTPSKNNPEDLIKVVFFEQN